MGGHARELEDLGGTRSAHSVTLLRRAGGGHETRGTHDGGIFFGSEDFLDTARDEGLALVAFDAAHSCSSPISRRGLVADSFVLLFERGLGLIGGCGGRPGRQRLASRLGGLRLVLLGLDGWEVQVRSEAVEDDELAGLGHGVGLPRSLGE